MFADGIQTEGPVETALFSFGLVLFRVVFVAANEEWIRNDFNLFSVNRLIRFRYMHGCMQEKQRRCIFSLYFRGEKFRLMWDDEFACAPRVCWNENRSMNRYVRVHISGYLSIFMRISVDGASLA